MYGFPVLDGFRMVIGHRQFITDEIHHDSFWHKHDGHDDGHDDKNDDA